VRRPRLRDVGEEPDPRFTLANERTFLAWIRTSLALMAAGLAVSEFLQSEPRAERLMIGIPLVVIAGAIGAEQLPPMGDHRAGAAAR
jgi:putative membrane protein